MKSMTDEITMLILLGYSIKCIGAGSSHPTTTFLTSGMAFQGSCGLGNNMCKQTEAPPPLSSYAAITENPTN
jgi:hypothetical protein